MKRWIATAAATIAATSAVVGCATLDERQREWIFQPSDATWGSGAELAKRMDSVWIDFDSTVTKQPARLHALWAQAKSPAKGEPVLLYLHGARWNVESSTPRIRRLQEMGFSVLAIDYRGFGKSSPGLPSEDTAYEDAQAAWRWLASKYPGRPRYIYGHSLGGAIAIDLASKVDDERGTIVEATFTSIPDVASTMKWGWLPIGPLITQRFDSVRKVAKIGSPLLVVHGDDDDYVKVELGRKLYEAATGPKRFLLVEGGTHHSTMSVGFDEYRQALGEMFGLR
jgi:alpha-beta hydrolase superfamily lysophospholipase